MLGGEAAGTSVRRLLAIYWQFTFGNLQETLRFFKPMNLCFDHECLLVNKSSTSHQDTRVWPDTSEQQKWWRCSSCRGRRANTTSSSVGFHRFFHWSEECIQQRRCVRWWLAGHGSAFADAGRWCVDAGFLPTDFRTLNIKQVKGLQRRSSHALLTWMPRCGASCCSYCLFYNISIIMFISWVNSDITCLWVVGMKTRKQTYVWSFRNMIRSWLDRQSHDVVMCWPHSQDDITQESNFFFSAFKSPSHPNDQSAFRRDPPVKTH